jgi:hypothetical protein
MTTEEALQKIKEMMEDEGNGLDYLYKRCKSLLNSNAVDKDKFKSDEYVLPKIILCAALLDLSDQYKPFSEEYRKDVENLKHF